MWGCFFIWIFTRLSSLNLFDTSLFTCEGAQVVELSTTNTTTLVDSDAVDSW